MTALLRNGRLEKGLMMSCKWMMSCVRQGQQATLREVQLPGEQTVADTLAANERLQPDMKKANEAYRQQLSQQHQRLTSDIDRERSLREQSRRRPRWASSNTTSTDTRGCWCEGGDTQTAEHIAHTGASERVSIDALQADMRQLRSIHIDSLTEIFDGLTTADQFTALPYS
ncbi:unnamed protein product [Vitrella brassicaformis CCMP3155]|uniref:Uncharacterized protein n=1 Tax=Vitrella brassicaformis (strain CCMP3155) TaxID=1169540 RepID=A0A0G4F3G3_VITBC|nr:unnamed protein product [Vitrella brassicaformis CCMP3155]|eukprot:CEM05961.1 unnamed protein product [Vitrella brassicaformis CCMP3155]